MANEVKEGHWIAGRFVSGVQQEDRASADGRTFKGRFIVTLLVNDRSVPIEYSNEAQALAAIGSAGALPGDMAAVAAKVGVRAAAKGGVPAYAFFFGA
jgi:hypothetical protein